MSPKRPASLRALIRDGITSLFIILTTPLWLFSRLEDLLTKKEIVFTTCSEFLSLVPGPLGIFMRRGFYAMSLDACAWDASIGFGTTLSHRSTSISHYVYIGGRCTVGMASIEDHATIGSNVDILSGRRQHHFSDLGRPLQEQGGCFTRLRIGRNCWIGNGGVVMADVGEEAVVGAGSVVVKPIPDWCVAVGNPARVLRSRRPVSRGLK